MDARFDGKRALVTGAGKGMLIIKMISELATTLENLFI